MEFDLLAQQIADALSGKLTDEDEESILEELGQLEQEVLQHK